MCYLAKDFLPCHDYTKTFPWKASLLCPSVLIENVSYTLWILIKDLRWNKCDISNVKSKSSQVFEKKVCSANRRVELKCSCSPFLHIKRCEMYIFKELTHRVKLNWREKMTAQLSQWPGKARWIISKPVHLNNTYVINPAYFIFTSLGK